MRDLPQFLSANISCFPMDSWSFSGIHIGGKEIILPLCFIHFGESPGIALYIYNSKSLLLGRVSIIAKPVKSNSFLLIKYSNTPVTY